MYIIMYKYSTFKIKRKSFRSSMSKNFPVIPGLTGDLTLPRHDGRHVMADLIGHPSSTGHLLPGLFSPPAHNNY